MDLKNLEQILLAKNEFNKFIIFLIFKLNLSFVMIFSYLKYFNTKYMDFTFIEVLLLKSTEISCNLFSCHKIH